VTDAAKYVTDEAIGEALRHRYDGGASGPASEMRYALEAALPHIEPAIRADERAKVTKNVTQVALDLVGLARQIRGLGDIPFVSLSKDGVGPAAITLAGQLELAALNLDFGAVTANAQRNPA
jgi:hypothetical protein